MMLDWQERDKQLTVASKTYDDWQTFISEQFWRYCLVLSDKNMKTRKSVSHCHEHISRSQWSSGNMPNCSVKDPVIESHHMQLRLSGQPLRYSALGTGCAYYSAYVDSAYHSPWESCHIEICTVSLH